MKATLRSSAVLLLAAAGTVFSATAPAKAYGLFPFSLFAPPPPAGGMAGAADVAEDRQSGAASARFARQTVEYRTNAGAGSVIIDTPNTYLYFVLGNGRAVRYGIGVGREGFTWSGTQTISRKAEWPDWTPPPQMLQRQPYLPRFVAGGPHNPLGARAMYLGGTVYRIHGTNQPETIGTRVSSGCIRMTNDDVIDLYSRVRVGTKVIVLPIGHQQAEERPGRHG